MMNYSEINNIIGGQSVVKTSGNANACGVKLESIVFRLRDIRPYMIVAALAAAMVYYVIFQFLYNMIAYDDLCPFRSFSDVSKSVIHNFPPIFILFLLNYVVAFHLFPRVSSRPFKFLVDGIASFGILSLTNFSFMILVSPKVDWAGTVFCNTFIWMGWEMVWYVWHFKQLMVISQRAIIASQRYRYDVLRSQVNPHFLFNSLNLLYSLVSTERREDAEKFIIALVKTYRYIIDIRQKDVVTLAEELDFLDSYVKVLEMRYLNQFKVSIVGRSLAASHTIIPYTMQLLIENVTKHNTISSRNPMVVTVEITATGVTVSNPIMKRVSSAGTGFGLRYLRELYAFHGMSFTAGAEGDNFVCKIPYLS